MPKSKNRALLKKLESEINRLRAMPDYSDEAEKFWIKWLKADEDKRIKMIEKLPLKDLMKSPELLNGYFEDLAHTLYNLLKKDGKKS
jgi:hypothetical protein